MNNGFQRTSNSGEEARRERQKAEFLNEAEKLIENEYYEYSGRIIDGFKDCEAGLTKALSVLLNQIYYDYRRLMQRGEVGELKYIYFSFLRTSMMDGHPAYRIDFYDEKDVYSDIECYGEWSFEYVFTSFDKIKTKVLKIFSGQSRVKAYEADNLLYLLYERFHELAAAHLPALVESCLIDEINIENENLIEIKEGDLFDSTVTVGKWQTESAGMEG